MSDVFRNAIRGIAASLDRGAGQPRFGNVTSFNPDRYAAKVALQPENVLTGWLPICTAMIGSGWGLATPVSVGDLVLVLPQEGAAGHGVIVGRIWTDQAQPPVDSQGNQAQSGTLLLRSKNGTIVQLDASDTITITGANNASFAVTVTGSGKVTLTGPEIDIGASGATLHKLMNDVAMQVYNQHSHAGGPVPDQQMTAGTHTTTALKAA